MLHKGNIEAAGRETLRLLKNTCKLLDEHLATEGFVHEADDDHKRQLDREKALRWNRALRNEIQKVENFETVVAVVGTVKAGKSMTINAIVGAEILPSRPDPMTTYPTLVRHKPGQLEPILKFHLAEDFIDLGRKAKARIQEHLGDRRIEEVFLSTTRERKSVDNVLSGKFEGLVETYVGRGAIFEVLELVNDLCRVCASLNLPLPAVSDETGARLPMIEIEMYHIGANHDDGGRFTILDSPGPNEAGQGRRLREVVREQLSQASAVLLVCDFTGLNTDADSEIQGYVKEVLAELTDRAFILVNKFDQRSARDWTADEVRKHLSQTILGGTIPPARIFPVSARSAFRANWALRELKWKGQLPDAAVDSNTEDFGNEALGPLWRELISDRAQRAAAKVWENSLFEEPLRSVIQVAARNASLLSLKSAIAKVVTYNRVLERFLKIRETAATKSAKAIQGEIGELQSDIENTEKAYDQVVKLLDERVGLFSDLMRGVSIAAGQEVSGIIAEYFRTGQLMQSAKEKSSKRKAIPAQVAESIGDKIDAIQERLFGSAKQGPNSKLGAMPQDFDPAAGFNKDTGTYEIQGTGHRKKADKLLSLISQRLLDVFLHADKAMQTALAEEAHALSERLRTDVEDSLRAILRAAQERLKRAFDITFEFPEPNLKTSELILQQFDSDVIQTETRINETHRKQKGTLGSVKRWFGDWAGTWWGYEVVKEETQISTINLNVLRDEAMQRLGGFQTEKRHQAESFVNSVLREAVDTYFDRLKVYIEAFRGDLLDAMNDQRLKKESLEELHRRIKKLKDDVEDVLNDGCSLEAALEAT